MDDLFSKPLAELSPADKRALLARLLTEAAAPAEQSFPLSHGQKALWFIHQLTPGTAAYNVASAIRVKGPLNIPVLRAAVQAVVDRHASLRTTFSRAASGEPLQTVHAEGSYAYTQVDATVLAWDEVYRRLSDDGYYPFDLAQAPLFRVSLYTLAPADHVLLLVMNHIVVDFWSMSILMQDFLALYEAMSRGGEVTLPPLDAQFQDVVEWERTLVAGDAGDVGEALFRYWSDVLAGELPVLKLPADRPRPPLWSDEGSLFIYRISQEMVYRLRTLAHAEGATLFMILLAAFQVLMHRISGQDDLLVGSPVAGRGLADFDQVVGYFVNTVVLRASLAEEPPFRGFLGGVRQTVLGAFAHQDYPFPLLVERLQPRRSPAYSPVFQVMFNLVQPRRMEQAGLARILLGDAGGKIRFNELEMESFSLEQRTANFDLTLTAVEVEESLFAQWQFSTRLFDTATIARLAACYETLLTAVLADPDRRISGLSLLTAEERQELLIERNRKVFDLPAAQGFLQLFEAQVERTPESTAVVSASSSKTERLTYRDLNAAANRLGRSLVERQAGPETLVAIFAQRGVNFLTAVLAAFKAGGAYLPLDPFYPARRLRQMLENSRAPFVLVEEALVESLAGVLSAVEPRPAVLVIEDLLRADHPQEENLPPRSGPSHLAYVIYTSGSTGAPKGAMIAAEGMLSHLFAKIADLELAAADVIAQTASQCFDISVWQYLAALLVGGRTHVIDAATAGDPRLLLRHAEEHGITILESVPSLIAEMVREAGPDRPPLGVLRWLVATGEDLPPELCRRWLACYPRIPLLNAYGPTECSDDVTHYAVPEPPGADVVRMPVGRPIANMRIYVLDRALEPVPDGVTGELCAGGLGVGRGYLGDPGRTAAVFVPDPFSPSPGGRLYRTGDAARWRDGTLELLGRLDSQVKVRGQRIELQEIELSLAQHPNVGEAVVVAVRGPSAGNRLVAYVVPRQTPAPPMHLIQELRAFLQEKLPQSMVPSAFMVLDALPHGPTGKVDRGALPAPDSERPELANTFVAPRTEVESRLAELWAELLNVERVGVHDNFFELGGHSLLGIQLLSRVRDSYAMDVPARSFFENPTVAGLAQLVSGVSDVAPAKTWTRTADLRTEVSLDPAITPQGPPRAGLE
ncbi:MAG TPA: amino acid adenylation domain-containing protein, partial [Thermoanaerobaculia bacterium]